MAPSIAILLFLVPSIFAKGQGCGGLLEGDNGNFRYSLHAVVDGKNSQNCVWLVQAYGATQIQFTLDEFLPGEENSAIIFYPDRTTGETSLNPITRAITFYFPVASSTLTLQSSAVIIILPQSNSTLAFTWESTFPDGFNPNDSVTLADYIIDVPEGQLTWTPARRQEKIWWIIAAGASANDAVVEWKTQVDSSDCDRNRPCSCLSFEAFELSTDGNLLEISRTCGRSSSGVFQMQSSPLVVAASANTTERGASKVELRWGEDEGASSTMSTATSTTSTTSAPTTTAVPAEPLSRLYFSADRVINAFSPDSNEFKMIANNTEYPLGITYDAMNNKLYWSVYNKIYQSNMDGSQVQTVLDTYEYGDIYDLAFDWAGGNIYVASRYILACGVGTSRSFSCYTVLDDQASPIGISLDPNNGLMYWSSPSLGSIRRAEMDGSNPLTLVSGLKYPRAITIDFASRRLYWADWGYYQIQSSDLDGRDIQLVFQLGPSGCLGLAVWTDRIYFGNDGHRLQSCAKDGQDMQTLYTAGDGNIGPVTVISALDQPPTRRNDCAGQNCSKLCVVTQASYRCLA